jgi:hypothetical protein
VVPKFHLSSESVSQYLTGERKYLNDTFFSLLPYLHNLKSIKCLKVKKSMLKNKSILFKDGQLEIGVIISKDTNVKVALYFQSEVQLN